VKELSASGSGSLGSSSSNLSTGGNMGSPSTGSGSNIKKVDEIPKPLLPKGYKEGVAVLLDWSPIELARQLTLMEFKIFRRIQPKEYLNQSWNKTDKLARAPNICSLIDSFNNTGRLLATSILKLPLTPQRSKMLKKWIAIADQCFQLRNFNTTMGIVSGLTSASIGRLKQSWNGVPTKWADRFHELEKETATTNNFAKLRESTIRSPPPKIPYIGITLTDLTFVEDGNPDFVKDGKLINFSKRQLLAKIIVDMQTYQTNFYKFKEISSLQVLLSSFSLYDDKEAYNLSKTIEPSSTGGSLRESSKKK